MTGPREHLPAPPDEVAVFERGPTALASGSVLGVDVGFSLRRRSSAVCRLDFTRDTVAWTIERFRAAEPERTDTLRRVCDRPVLAAAFDGPLRRGFEVIGQYREAERVLVRGVGRRIGKPGSSGAPVGRRLNAATNECARIVQGTGLVAPACHRHAIDDAAIVEAFPNSFLGLLIETPEALVCRRGNRSDVYYQHLADAGRLDAVLAHLLTGRCAIAPFRSVTDHDERAALVCALTALGIAAGSYDAVGDDVDGWIILPARAIWRSWARPPGATGDLKQPSVGHD